MLFRLRRVRYHYEKRRLRVTNYGGGICFIGHLTITLTDYVSLIKTMKELPRQLLVLLHKISVLLHMSRSANIHFALGDSDAGITPLS